MNKALAVILLCTLAGVAGIFVSDDSIPVELASVQEVNEETLKRETVESASEKRGNQKTIPKRNKSEDKNGADSSSKTDSEALTATGSDTNSKSTEKPVQDNSTNSRELSSADRIKVLLMS